MRCERHFVAGRELLEWGAFECVRPVSNNSTLRSGRILGVVLACRCVETLNIGSDFAIKISRGRGIMKRDASSVAFDEGDSGHDVV